MALDLRSVGSAVAYCERLVVQPSCTVLVLGTDFFPTVATVLNNLASLYEDQGRYAEADPIYQRSLPSARRHWGRTTCPKRTTVCCRNYVKTPAMARRCLPAPAST